MNTCYFKDNKLIIGNNEYSFEDLLTTDFYSYSDTIADLYFTGEVYDNILFQNIIQKIMSVKFFLNNNSVDKLIVEDNGSRLSGFVEDAGIVLGITKKKTSSFGFFRNVRIAAKMFGAMLYLFYKQIGQKHVKREVDYRKNFAVLRTRASKGKIKQTEDRELFIEDSIGVGNFYTFFPFRDRIKCMFKGWLESRKTIKALEQNLEKWGIYCSANYTLDFFAYRLVAVKYYQEIIGNLFELPWNGYFISGNNLDMYAIAEELEAKKRRIPTICIPHGIEYGFKFPHCFTGDTFFTFSQNAASHLNSLYNSDKFVFNEQIIAELLNVNCLCNNEKKIVYFCDSMEPNVNINIIDVLLKKCTMEKIPLYIKHHPNDDLKDYRQYDSSLNVIEDLSDAIFGNICLGRKSTILLEGLYNNSQCAAIITNAKDKAIFYSFPSLQDKKIAVFFEIDKAAEWAIEKYYEKC